MHAREEPGAEAVARAEREEEEGGGGGECGILSSYKATLSQV